MSSGSLLRGVVSLVEAMGGRLEHRIRLQKSAYLLQQLGLADFEEAWFKYHHYGPYSRWVSDALHDAISAGLLIEEQEPRSDGGAKYTYVVTEKGRTWLGKRADRIDRRIHELGPMLRDEDWRSLELAATALFLQDDEALANLPAMERALELKPPCIPYREKAEQLLQRLGL